MLGLAIRIAQRIGLHNESTYAKYPALEAEMRRRLWWSLVLYDTRVSELVDDSSVILVPTWDCKTPLNVNDFDLQPEMTDPPAFQGKSTEALFAVVRGEMGDFVRHSAFHLDFTVPALKTVAKDVQRGSVPEGGELAKLEKMIEDKYLRFCNPENPLHFMTIWTTRGHFARNRLLDNYSRFLKSPLPQTGAQRDAAVSYALKMLEYDTMIMTSPLTKGYRWHTRLYFPFPAYIHILQDARKRPVSDHAEQAWKTMSENYESRFMSIGQRPHIFVKLTGKTILQAWEAREAVLNQSGNPVVPPRMVSDIGLKVGEMAQDTQRSNIEEPTGTVGMNIDDFLVSMPMDFSGYGLAYNTEWQGYLGSETGAQPDVPGQAALDADFSQLSWTTRD